MHYPDEERAAARPLKTTPCYDRMKALGAVFGSVYGWERPNWFAPAGYAVPKAELDVGADVLIDHNHAPPLADGRIVEKWSFRRSNYFAHRRQRGAQRHRECRPAGHVAVRQMLDRRPGRGSLAGIDPRQPDPEEGRPHRALPPAHPAWRRAQRVHRLPRERAATIWSRPAPSRRTTMTFCASSCRPTAACRSTRSPPNGGCWCWPAPTAARCCRNSPARRSQCLFPVAVGQADLGRRGDRSRIARQFRRRARLGASPSDRDAEHAFSTG